ncbi:MAG TPA: hypothetical protein VMQ73_23235 [Methylomirabilota bacterium]|nr:hypothetical protein [Methylomirabilota bacterium]
MKDQSISARARRGLTAGGILLAVAVGACANPPPPALPAMVARSAGGDYGYAETAQGADLYTVTYVTPSLPAPGDPDNDYGLAGQKQRAYSLALWRAAQLAVEKGYPAFRVEHESRDVNVIRTPPVAPPPYLTTPLRTSLGPPCRWDCGNPIGYWDDSYFNPRYDEWYIRSHASGRAVATLTVKMLPAMADGAQDAAETEKQLRATYATATFSP